MLDTERADVFPSMWQILYNALHTGCSQWLKPNVEIRRIKTRESHFIRFSNNCSKLSIANFSITLCPCWAEYCGRKVISIFVLSPPANRTASSPTCAEICWGRWRWSLPPRMSIFGRAETACWPWCHGVPSATTQSSQAAILAIYGSCQMGSWFRMVPRGPCQSRSLNNAAQ